MYLGRSLSITDSTETELHHRLQKGWRTFFAHKHQLCNKSFPISRRLKLFNSTVSAVVLYGCGAWTMKRDHLRRLQTEQRKMLRMMVDMGRRFVRQGGEGESNSDNSNTESEPTDDMEECLEDELVLEDWVDWIRRSTAFAEQQLEKAHITDWVTEQRKRYWQFAGRMARHSDGRWSNAVLTWKPQGWRHAGSPCKRWSDDKVKYHTHDFGGSRNDWIISAQDLQTWEELENRFVEVSLPTT